MNDQELAAIESEATAALHAASTLGELDAAEGAALSKRSRFAAAYQQLGSLPADERREAGRQLNELRQRLTALAAQRRSELGTTERAARPEADRLDLTEVLPARGLGHLHLVTRTAEALEDVFVGMGYEVAEGPEVETDWYNFEALNLPPDHPARGMWDTFYLELGEPGSVLMRTHTSPMQIRLLESRP